MKSKKTYTQMGDAHLKAREAEILMWTACGKTSQEIAQCIGLSEETVRAYIKTICRKLKAANKTHATAIALIHGLICAGPTPKRAISLPVLFGLSEPLKARNSNGEAA